eukprot:TRINITY_DN7138_c0_g1_i1.p1 TRINITY_DN7138_c0_g1~~TRINITY_DN7138_c0_g1_i1.p1  ORF type:complete len:408 (+),score=10.21 TRINITY_DN7138_c0_g1_i1:136-1359(+)
MATSEVRVALTASAREPGRGEALQAPPAARTSADFTTTPPTTTASLQQVLAAYEMGNQFPRFWSDPLGLKDLKLSVLRHYLPRVVIALLIYSVFMYYDCIIQAILQFNLSNYYSKRWTPKPPYTSKLILWDFGHLVFPQLDTHKLWWLSPDSIVSLGPQIVTLRFFLLTGPLSLRWVIMCRYFVLNGILFGFRGITIIATLLPNPYVECKPKITYPNQVFATAWEIFVHHDVTCHDVLYSGHTIVLTLTVLIVLKYTPRAPWMAVTYEWRHNVISHFRIIQILCLAYWLLGIYSIIASHFHYTVDVIIAAVMTYFCFYTYHYCIEVAPFRYKGFMSIYSFLAWFEKDAPDLKVVHRCDYDVQERVARHILQEHTVGAILASGRQRSIASISSSAPASLTRIGANELV